VAREVVEWDKIDAIPRWALGAGRWAGQRSDDWANRMFDTRRIGMVLMANIRIQPPRQFTLS
jgi:hypothetical protein